jgi:hypothetical protein
VRFKRKIQNKPMKLLSANVARSKAAKTVRNSDGASRKKTKRNGNE